MKSEPRAAARGGGARLAAIGLLAAALAAPGAAQTTEGKPMTATTAPGAQGDGVSPASRLRPLLPERLAGWQRRTLDFPEPTLGPRIAQARAEYRRGTQVALVDISDLTATPPPTWTGEPLERDIETGRERVWRDGTRTRREESGKTGQPNRVGLSLANGIVVGVSGAGVPVAELRRLADALDLAAAEQLARR